MLIKKILASLTISIFLCSQVLFAGITSVSDLKGLQRLAADKIEDGSHSVFNNAYITDEGNIRVVKGRVKLNTTAHTDTTVSMVCYYENSTGSTKKLVVKESDEIVTYDTDGTNRTSILGSLTDEKADCVQIGDTMYFNSSTDGLHKWAGTGSASAIAGVGSPSVQNFSSSSSVGGMTGGADGVGKVNFLISGKYWRGSTGTGSCVRYYSYVASHDLAAQPTSSLYKYKTTFYNSKWGIESESSSSDSATLSGGSSRALVQSNCFPTWTSGTCTLADTARCSTGDVIVYGGSTSTTATLSGSEPLPFDQHCIYRTVASGSDYFLVGCQDSATSTFKDGTPDVALTRPLDTTINTIDPPSFRYINEYKGVLFTSEGTSINFTRLPVEATTNGDKYWLETDKILTGAKKPLTGIHSTSNNLLLFTSSKVISVSGFGVDSFRTNVLFEQIGTVSDETIETDNNGDVIFFAGTTGVYKIRIGQSPTDDLTGAVIDQPNTNTVRISSPFLDNVFNGTDTSISLDPADYTLSHAYYDSDKDIYWLYIGDHAFMFNNKSNQWSHLPATEMIGSVYVKSPNSAGQGILVDDLGFFYKNWYGYASAVISGSATGEPTSSSSTTLTDTGATFNTTDDGLAGAWVFVDNENGEHRQIQSNTTTTITVSPAWTVNPVTSDDYYVGYIIYNTLTKQYAVAEAPSRAKIDYIYLVHSKSDSSQIVELMGYENKASYPVNLKNIDMLDKFVSKRSVPMGATKYWFQWGLRSFVYNTSNTINPPIDIQAYAIDWEEIKEL